MNIYSNPQLYDAIHHNYKWDIKLIRSIAKDINGSVLELASGTGRLAQEIIELGFDYTGIELSESFLNCAKKKCDDGATFILGDMRNFDLGSHFDFILIGFNSFLHNLTRSDARSCLKCIKTHLSNNGKFLLSIFIPNPTFLQRNNDKLYSATDYFHYEDQQCRIMEKNSYNFESQINEITWLLEKDGIIESEEYHFMMRMFYPHEMDLLLSDSGFIIKEKFGDYDCSPMNAESEMQIYLCESF